MSFLNSLYPGRYVFTEAMKAISDSDVLGIQDWEIGR